MNERKQLVATLSLTALKETRALVPFSTNKRFKPTARQSILLHCVRNKVPKHLKNQINNMQLSPHYGYTRNQNTLFQLTNCRGQHYSNNLSKLSQWLKTKRQGRSYYSKHHQDGSLREPVHQIENEAKNSIKYHIGNCDELSSVALCFLLEMPCNNQQPIIVEKIWLDKYDHCFLILDRDLSGDIKDIASWGKHAIICDPWAGSVFDVSYELNTNPMAYNMFDFILKALRDKKETVTILHSDMVGEGHSQRWINKKRPLISEQTYEEQEETIFFPCGQGIR